jgi:hypothetical protein
MFYEINVAVGVRFELTVRISTHNALAKHRFRPLSQPTAIKHIMAVGEGFEPSERILYAQWFSKPPQ